MLSFHVDLFDPKHLRCQNKPDAQIFGVTPPPLSPLSPSPPPAAVNAIPQIYILKINRSPAAPTAPPPIPRSLDRDAR